MNNQVIVIGAGFGGQIAAIKLIEAGITDIVVLERTDTAGGTRTQHSYPGASVDVHSPYIRCRLSHMPGHKCLQNVTSSMPIQIVCLIRMVCGRKSD